MISIELAAFIAIVGLLLLVMAVGVAAFFGTRRELLMRGSSTRREVRRMARDAAKKAKMRGRNTRPDPVSLVPIDREKMKAWVDDVPPIPQIRVRSIPTESKTTDAR